MGGKTAIPALPYHSGNARNYRVCEAAPSMGRWEQENKQYETPQLQTMPYRMAMTPGKSPTYAKHGAKADRRHGDG